MPLAEAAPIKFATCPTCLGGGTGGTGVTTLGALTDVTLTAPLQANQALVFNGAVWENKVINLNDLGDVDAATPADGQTIVWDSTANAGAGGYVLGNAGAAANPSVHLTNTAVAPATAGAPTLAEITAAAGANRDRILYYTGSDTATDPVTYAYFIDVNGVVTPLEQPTAATTVNPVVHLTNTLVAPATAGQPTLAEIITAAGANRDTFLTYTGTDTASDPVTYSYYIDPAGSVVLVEQPAPAAVASPTLFLTNTAVGPATAGTPTVAEITAAAGAARDTIITYTGTDNSGDPITHVYYIDSAGLVTTLQSPNTAAANPTAHLTNTAVAPATAGSPTAIEITVAAAAGGHTDKVLTYTGTDNAGDAVTHAYWVDVNGLVTLLQRPDSGNANPTLHLTDTAIAPATAGDPTIAEITAAAGANRDVFLYYTGTDNPADVITHVYFIDTAGSTVLVEGPPITSCALRELGGINSALAVGDGLGTPTPMAAGFTLRADELAAIVTTPPTGGFDQFEIRLMPAATVISTGTISAGNSVATFTPFTDVAFTAGQWIETVVTAVAATPGSDLTVVGEVCGPGVGVSGGSSTDRDEVAKLNSLPADDTNHDLIDLEGHPTLPNGLYRWDATGGSWAQV